MKWEYLILNLIPGLILGLVTVLYQWRPPQSPNSFYGYRTLRSMASQQAWDFANKRSIFWLWVTTIALLITGVIFTYFVRPKVAQTVLYVGTCLLLLGIVAIIERELKKRFEQ